MSLRTRTYKGGDLISDSCARLNGQLITKTLAGWFPAPPASTKPCWAPSCALPEGHTLPHLTKEQAAREACGVCSTKLMVPGRETESIYCVKGVRHPDEHDFRDANGKKVEL